MLRGFRGVRNTYGPVFLVLSLCFHLTQVGGCSKVIPGRFRENGGGIDSPCPVCIPAKAAASTDTAKNRRKSPATAGTSVARPIGVADAPTYVAPSVSGIRTVGLVCLFFFSFFKKTTKGTTRHGNNIIHVFTDSVVIIVAFNLSRWTDAVSNMSITKCGLVLYSTNKSVPTVHG